MRRPSRLEAERAAARERERIAEENATRLAEERMAQEVEDYKMPSRTRPVPANTAPMSERERLAMRERREEQEAEERSEREARERPIREAEAQLKETHRQLAVVERQRLTDPKIIDVDYWVDPQIEEMDWLAPEGMADWNIAHFRNFAQNHPELAITDGNLETLNSYFKKHGALMFTENMLEKVYQRMRACGILFDAPEPETPDILPNGTPNYAKRPQANLTITRAEKPQPQTYQGFDLETSEPRIYTEHEVARMSSEQFRKAMQMVVRGEMQLPTTGPGTRGRSY